MRKAKHDWLGGEGLVARLLYINCLQTWDYNCIVSVASSPSLPGWSPARKVKCDWPGREGLAARLLYILFAIKISMYVCVCDGSGMFVRRD